jgi:hypothetical protein
MYEHGQRVELIQTNDPHTRLRPGDQGTVASYDPALAQLDVTWDSGSRLSMLLAEGDQVRPIGPRSSDPPLAGTGRLGVDVNDREPVVTAHLADGRIVDVFPSGTVHVYFDNLRHAYEFQLPATTPTGRDPLIRFIRLA